MSKISTRSKTFALLTAAAIALAACGGSGENLSSESTAAVRTKNGLLDDIRRRYSTVPRVNTTTTTIAPTTTTTTTTTTTVLPTTTTNVPTCVTGACKIGDIGPGGGKVFYVADGMSFKSQAACSWCRHLEAAPVGWITAATPTGQKNCGPVGQKEPGRPTAGTSTADPMCFWTYTSSATNTTRTEIGAGFSNTLGMWDRITDSLAATVPWTFSTRAATVAKAYQGGGKKDWYLPSKDELDQMYLHRSAIGLDSGPYWSSSEINTYSAWSSSGAVRKSNALYVRPVRAF